VQAIERGAAEWPDEGKGEQGEKGEEEEPSGAVWASGCGR